MRSDHRIGSRDRILGLHYGTFPGLYAGCARSRSQKGPPDGTVKDLK